MQRSSTGTTKSKEIDKKVTQYAPIVSIRGVTERRIRLEAKLKRNRTRRKSERNHEGRPGQESAAAVPRGRSVRNGGSLSTAEEGVVEALVGGTEARKPGRKSH